MANIIDAIYNIRQFDELARRSSMVHKLNPLAKLSAVLMYVLVLVSFGKYEVLPLLPLVIFPVYLISAGGIPLKPLLKRLICIEPMIMMIGLLNPLFDRGTVLFYGRAISAGWLISASIILKGTLAVTAALLLIATTGMEGVSVALRHLKVPKVFVLQTAMTYRYITVLLEETVRTLQAHWLRSLGHRGIGRKAWGPLLGQILLRTMDRAQRIYDAMRLRGFNGEYHIGSSAAFGPNDVIYIAVWGVFFIMARRVNIPLWLGNIVTGAR